MAVVDSVVIQEGQNLPGKCGGRVTGLEEFRKHFAVASSSFFSLSFRPLGLLFKFLKKGFFSTEWFLLVLGSLTTSTMVRSVFDQDDRDRKCSVRNCQLNGETATGFSCAYTTCYTLALIARTPAQGYISGKECAALRLSNMPFGYVGRVKRYERIASYAKAHVSNLYFDKDLSPIDARGIICKKIHQSRAIPRWKALTLLFPFLYCMKNFIDSISRKLHLKIDTLY